MHSLFYTEVCYEALINKKRIMVAIQGPFLQAVPQWCQSVSPSSSQKKVFFRQHGKDLGLVILACNVKNRDDSGGRFSNRPEAWVRGVFSCGDSYSSVPNTITWLCSSTGHPNYLALFIIQRLHWRQALGSPKDNCFYT